MVFEKADGTGRRKDGGRLVLDEACCYLGIFQTGLLSHVSLELDMSHTYQPYIQKNELARNDFPAILRFPRCRSASLAIQLWSQVGEGYT